MESVPQMAEVITRILNEEAEQLARTTGFIQRQRNFSGADLAQAMILGSLQEPQVSTEGLTQILQRRQVKISAPGLSEHFNEQAADFFVHLLWRLSAVQLHTEAVAIPLLGRFSAVIVEDSSAIPLPNALAKVWRGCGGTGAAGQAGVKLFARWDVLRGKLEGPSLTDGRCSDKRGPFAVEDLPEGCLYVADLGFFSLPRFCQLCRRRRKSPKAKRYFVSRYMPKTVLLTRSRKRITLRQRLPQQEGKRVEFLALLGRAGRLLVRVVIERVPKDVAQQRRQHIREVAQAHGRQPDAEVLALAAWTIVLTNVPQRLLSAEELLVVLRLRWQIELLFKLWKEHGHIDEWRSKKPWRILCELYAKLCAMVIQQWLIQVGCWQDPHRSLVKAAQVVRREANRIMVALYEGGLEPVLHGIVRCMQSGCRLNTRKTNPNTSQFLLGTPLVWPKRRSKPKPRAKAYVLT